MARIIPYEDTTVSVSKSLAEIEEMLVVHKATAVLREYESGRIKGLAFKVGDMPFRMPARVDALYSYLLKKKRDSPIYRIHTKALQSDGQQRIHEQAERVAWRNLAAWVKAQLALVEIGMVQVSEVFMPYMLVGEETAYERLTIGKEIPALPAPRAAV